jgi:hypothetical protein
MKQDISTYTKIQKSDQKISLVTQTAHSRRRSRYPASYSKLFVTRADYNNSFNVSLMFFCKNTAMM